MFSKKISETTGQDLVFPQERGLMVRTRQNHINEKTWFILNIRKYKFHSNYAIKHPPFTDGEQPDIQGGRRADTSDGRKQQANRTAGSNRHNNRVGSSRHTGMSFVCVCVAAGVGNGVSFIGLSKILLNHPKFPMTMN